jgi:hypothetical protein
MIYNDLEGPSRTITVEPLELPVTEPVELPAPAEPVETPAEPVPA